MPKVTQDSSNLYSEVPGRKKGHRPTVPITEDSGEFPQPLFIQSLLLPSPPFCCCCASDGTSQTLSRALPVARPFCSPSWRHRPIWGELRLKDPYCPSPRGSRALASKMTSSPNYPPRGTWECWQSVQTQPIVASGLSRTLERPDQTLLCPGGGSALKRGSNLRLKILTYRDSFADDEHDYEEILEQFSKTL